jgi:hypothetical protein
MTLADQGDGKAQRLLFDVAVEYSRRSPATRAPRARAKEGLRHVADLIERSVGRA